MPDTLKGNYDTFDANYNADVIYNGSDDDAPWGAKSLNGVVITQNIHDIKLKFTGNNFVYKGSDNSIDFIVEFSPLNSKPNDFSNYTLNPVITLETDYDDSDIEDESELVNDKFNIEQHVIDNEYHLIITPTSDSPITKHTSSYDKNIEVKANLYKDGHTEIIMAQGKNITVLADPSAPAE